MQISLAAGFRIAAISAVLALTAAAAAALVRRLRV